jgi:hypothetical protein
VASKDMSSSRCEGHYQANVVLGSGLREQRNRTVNERYTKKTQPSNMRGNKGDQTDLRKGHSESTGRNEN